MKQRGRKSAASKLAVIDGTRGSRPSPPGDLSDFEAAKWAEIIGAMPADWFKPEMTDLMRAYCRVCKIVFTIDKMLDQLDEGDLLGDIPPENIVQVIKLTSQRDKQVRQLAMLATKMRLTPQARQEPKTAGRARQKAAGASGSQPWEN